MHDAPCRTTGFDETEHDHQACVAQALTRAEQLCQQRGARLTPQRRRILELVWQTHRPVGAYDLLQQLQREMRAAPPTVYRALDFLQQQGLVHRLASINAYVGCSLPDRPHDAYFFICRSCRGMTPLRQEGLTATIRRQAAALDFRIEQETVEILGLCPQCRQQGAA